MTDTDSYLEKLILSDPLRKRVITEAIDVLRLPKDSRGLDAGCGIGTHTLMLAEEVGPEGHVTGLDISDTFLDYARRQAEVSAHGSRVTFERGDLTSLRFDENSFDWIWSMDCASVIAADPVRCLRNWLQALKPGGIIAVSIWSSQVLLPGYPSLEAELNATSAGIAPFTKNTKPERHPLRMRGWFRQAGLTDMHAGTLVETIQAPLSEDIRKAMISLFDMRWGEAREEVPPESWETYVRLTQPDSPECILDQPDYYAFFTYSMFTGRAPA